MGHTGEITCIAIHPSQQIVATGDLHSTVHVWKGDSLQALAIIKRSVSEGIKHIAFSPSGDRIASVAWDADHTIGIFDVSTCSLISSSKGMISPSIVYDFAYSNSGTELVLVGKKQIVFFVGVHTNKRALGSQIGRIGSKGRKQSFFCATYFKDDCIVGCASGELYRFRDHACVEIIQAHGVREPVLSLYYNQYEGTILSGGSDSLIKTWDYTLLEVGDTIDMTEDIGQGVGTSLDGAVISLQQWDTTILVGTKGCDIYEIQLPPNPSQHHSIQRIMSGHSSGEIWGLAMHPTKEEFCTCGDDRTLRLWSIRSHEQLAIKVLPGVSRSVAYNNLGEVICIGLVDGTVALIDAKTTTLRVYCTWKHSNRIITDLKAFLSSLLYK